MCRGGTDGTARVDTRQEGPRRLIKSGRFDSDSACRTRGGQGPTHDTSGTVITVFNIVLHVLLCSDSAGSGPVLTAEEAVALTVKAGWSERWRQDLRCD